MQARVEELRTQLGELVDLLGKARAATAQSTLTTVMGTLKVRALANFVR